MSDNAELQLDEIANAIGTSRFMDPPDGGDVSLAEQVRRMRAKLDRHESLHRLETVDIAALVARAEKDRTLIRELVAALAPFAETEPTNVWKEDDEDGEFLLTENQFHSVRAALAKAKAAGFEP